MIEAIGLTPFNPTVTIKEIAKQISDRDNGVRNAALNVVTIAYQIVGDQVYKYTGKLNDKEMSYLEERIKRSAKTAVPQAKVEQAKQDRQMTGSNSSSALGKKMQMEKERQQREQMPELPVGNGRTNGNHNNFVDEEQQQMAQMRSARNTWVF